MVDQQSAAVGIAVESPLHDVLHHDIFILVGCVHDLVGLAALRQWLQAAQVLWGCDGLDFRPSHRLLFPGSVGCRRKAVAVVQAVVHHVPRLHALVVGQDAVGLIEVWQTHAVRHLMHEHARTVDIVLHGDTLRIDSVDGIEMLWTAVEEINLNVVHPYVLPRCLGPYRLFAAALVPAVAGEDDAHQLHVAVAVVVIDRPVWH